MMMLGSGCSACRAGEPPGALYLQLGCIPQPGAALWSPSHPPRDTPTSLLGVEALWAVGELDVCTAVSAPHSLASSLFPCSHLNAVELGAASFWLRVALGATVTALVGFTLYRVLAKNK